MTDQTPSRHTLTDAERRALSHYLDRYDSDENVNETELYAAVERILAARGGNADNTLRDLLDSTYEGAVMSNARYGEGFHDGWRIAMDHVRAALDAAPAPTNEDCRCQPCPGRGNDGHGLTHCAECCMGAGVEAEPDCPTHGYPPFNTNDFPNCEGWACQSCGADNYIPAGFARTAAPAPTNEEQPAPEQYPLNDPTAEGGRGNEGATE